MRFYPFLLFMVCMACQDTPKADPKAQKIAQAFCECAASLVALNKEAEAMRSDTAVLELAKLGLEYERVKSCSDIIIGQHGGRLPLGLLSEVKKSLAEKCPEVAEQEDLLKEMLAE